MQLDKFIVVYKDGGLPEVWNTYTYQEVYRNNPDHFKGYRILTTFNENSAPFDTAYIEQEAARLYPDIPEAGDDGDRTIERSAHITAARQYMGEIEKQAARIKELEDHLKGIYEMYGDEWTNYAQEWTEKVLRISKTT